MADILAGLLLAVLAGYLVLNTAIGAVDDLRPRPAPPPPPPLPAAPRIGLGRL